MVEYFGTIFFFKRGQIYMKNPELVESKEKSNFIFLRFLIFELWSFFTQIFDEFFTMTRKIKN